MPSGPVCAEGAWVDEILLQGEGRDIALHLGEPVSRAELRRLVEEQQQRLEAAGLVAGGTVAVRMPPSLGCIVAMLSGWRLKRPSGTARLPVDDP